MRMQKNLSLTFPVDLPDGSIGHIYSLPISRSVFETYYAELGAVFTKCFAGDDAKHIALSAPQLCLPALKQVARDMGTWDTPGGVQAGLINELKRLTSVAYVGASGWETMPLDICIKRDIVDEDTESEVLSALCFFSAISRVAPKNLAGTFLQMAGSLRNWQTTASTFTEHLDSLPTSTPVESLTANLPPVVS